MAHKDNHPLVPLHLLSGEKMLLGETRSNLFMNRGRGTQKNLAERKHFTF